jgi:hypothetical protein
VKGNLSLPTLKLYCRLLRVKDYISVIHNAEQLKNKIQSQIESINDNLDVCNKIFQMDRKALEKEGVFTLLLYCKQVGGEFSDMASWLEGKSDEKKRSILINRIDIERRKTYEEYKLDEPASTASTADSDSDDSDDSSRRTSSSRKRPLPQQEISSLFVCSSDDSDDADDADDFFSRKGKKKQPYSPPPTPSPSPSKNKTERDKLRMRELMRDRSRKVVSSKKQTKKGKVEEMMRKSKKRKVVSSGSDEDF